ncbi:hypothetical protein CC78DRAFT_543501 [Lojkania enalia]|uniref:Uncharacterized protein n=1 Tax=Lojkania enalia TaxID=147567 RepID=A0A9P4KAR2_9PLEO|nr:hypothetical protein CC78DRAFT_543501 [Didymosphaeria enalia]
MAMETFINRQLNPTTECPICLTTFDEHRALVALEWNVEGCPVCRDNLFAHDRPETLSPFTPTMIWNSLCKQAPAQLHIFIRSIWRRLESLVDLDILNDTLLPALNDAGTLGQEINPFTQCALLLQALYDGTGVTTAHSLAVPLIRLARMMEDVFSQLPPYLRNVQRINILLWKANACVGLHDDSIRWDYLNEASTLASNHYFPLLFLYTIMISQSLAHHPSSNHWPKKRHERMNLVVERCCHTIGSDWAGNPSRTFKDKLVIVYEELRRHQCEIGRMSLRGKDGEENIVRGLWQTAAWNAKAQFQ